MTQERILFATGRLPIQPWMTHPGVMDVMQVLTAAGGQVRFVGGCVRNALCGRPVSDIDLATTLTPDAVLSALAASGIKTIPTGLGHGTVTAVAAGCPLEITTLRRDVETDGRHAVVAYTDDWRQDAARRDFTMNALFADGDGTLYDPFGGLSDLAAGRVRFVGDAELRIREDGLRLLRYFRFFAHFGHPPPDAAAVEACRKAGACLDGLSAERIATELLKLLHAPNPVPAVLLMQDCDLLSRLLPEAMPDGVARLAQLVPLERQEHQTDPDPRSVRRLAVLAASGDATGAAALAGRLRLSKSQKDRLQALAEPPWPLMPEGTAADHRRALHHLGDALYTDLVLLNWAEAKVGAKARTGAKARAGAVSTGEASTLSPIFSYDQDGPYRSMLAEREGWTPRRLPVSGDDVVALGVPQGREIGGHLQAVARWWESQDFQPDRSACLAWLRRRIQD